jgi:hypothetical protein
MKYKNRRENEQNNEHDKIIQYFPVFSIFFFFSLFYAFVKTYIFYNCKNSKLDFMYRNHKFTRAQKKPGILKSQFSCMGNIHWATFIG